MKHQPFRISVIGTSGSGKTTVSTEISRRLNLRHIELDAIHWRQGWNATPNKEFRALVEEATKGDSWVVDGNYSRVRDIVWSKAEIVVWLDLPFKIVFWRTFLRTVIRLVTRRKLWNNNRDIGRIVWS